MTINKNYSLKHKSAKVQKSKPCRFGTMSFVVRRLFSTEITPLMRIGRSLLNIPDEYKMFFTRKQPEITEIYSPNLKFIVHLESTIALPSTQPDLHQPERIFELTGLEEIFDILERLKTLIKWGHFYWRLSDYSALKLDPIRVIRPTTSLESEKSSVEMKIYWQLKVVEGENVIFIDGKERKMSLKSLLQVQLQRFQNHSTPNPQNNTTTILYTGITRYIFDTQSGYCTELHVERVEPKISGIDWKLRMSKVKFSEA